MSGPGFDPVYRPIEPEIHADVPLRIAEERHSHTSPLAWVVAATFVIAALVGTYAHFSKPSSVEVAQRFPSSSMR